MDFQLQGSKSLEKKETKIERLKRTIIWNWNHMDLYSDDSDEEHNFNTDSYSDSFHESFASDSNHPVRLVPGQADHVKKHY
jgi:hypothetical protein